MLKKAPYGNVGIGDTAVKAVTTPMPSRKGMRHDACPVGVGALFSIGVISPSVEGSNLRKLPGFST